MESFDSVIDNLKSENKLLKEENKLLKERER